MNTIIQALRNIVGMPDFYRSLTNNTNPTWDYNAMFEYFFACILLIVCVIFVFRFVINLVK